MLGGGRRVARKMWRYVAGGKRDDDILKADKTPGVDYDANHLVNSHEVQRESGRRKTPCLQNTETMQGVFPKHLYCIIHHKSLCHGSRFSLGIHPQRPETRTPSIRHISAVLQLHQPFRSQNKGNQSSKDREIHVIIHDHHQS